LEVERSTFNNGFLPLREKQMKFSKVIGKVDPNLVDKAADKLSTMMVEMSTSYTSRYIGSGYGGDPLIFALMYPVQQICTENIGTAATDGRAFYWSPKFVMKQTIIGLRLIACHEAWHALYMHPQRRGSRNPRLWNIAVDYIVNGQVMADISARDKNVNVVDVFTKNLGKFITIKQLLEKIKNPFISGEALATSEESIKIDPSEDRELTEKEKEQLEKQEKKEKCYFADPELPEELRTPEDIYSMLYKLLPKCPVCSRIGVFKKPQKEQKDQKSNGRSKKSKENNPKQQPGDQKGNESQDSGNQNGQNPGQCCGNKPGEGCPGCEGGFDILGIGDMVDDHMDTNESEEKIAKRVSDAILSAKKMAGKIPGSLEDELGTLTKPKIRWQDIVRCKLTKARTGGGKNDWTKFQTKPMFCGLMTPKRKHYVATFGCLVDTSGSMSSEDIAFGISQLMSLDERSEGTVVPADSIIYWDESTKIKKANIEELSKIKIVGRGGTVWGEFFEEYENHIGKCDFLIIITDGFLYEDVNSLKDPGIDVLWLITSGTNFAQPFGKSYNLRDM
jgi:predicted metal-dependent peptidase